MPVNERVQDAPVSTLRAVFAGIGRILNFTDKMRNKPTTAEAPAKPESTAPAPEGSTLEDTAAPVVTSEPDTTTPEAAAAETGVPDVVTAEATAPAATAAESEVPVAEAVPAEAKPKARSRAKKPAAKPAESEVGGHVKLVPSEESTEEPAAAEPVVTEPAVTEPAVAEPVAAAAEAPVAEAPVAETATAAPAAELPLANYNDLTIASLRARLRNLSVAQLGQLIEYEKSHAGRADVIAMFERRVAKIESEG